MSQVTLLPSYTEIGDALAKTESPLHAAEVHGLICGIVCAVSDKTDLNWEALAMGPQNNNDTKEILQQLYTTSFQQMSEFSFDFALVLPSDNVDINVRAESLGLWCQGFLIGLKQAKTPIEDRITAEVSDALHDLTEIAQVRYEDITSTDEDETAYYELVEYVRLVTLMIYHELKSGDIENSSDERLLH